MAPYPVSFDVPKPARFARVHVALRLLFLLVLSALGGERGWPWGLLYLLLPALAAGLSANKGGAGYLAEDGPKVTAALRWLLGAYAYLALLTDELPDRNYAAHLRFEVRPTGTPTPGSALLRLLTSLPGLLYLLVLGILSAVLWVVAMVLVLISADYPASLHRLQVGIYRYQARLLAYHASLVEEYPPLSLEERTPQRTDLMVRPPA